MSSVELPASFVWTKIQADAGQTVDRILNRKRQSGGTFWWGVGEPKENKVRMLSRPRQRGFQIVWQCSHRPGLISGHDVLHSDAPSFLVYRAEK
jgi:hypothetical protein